MDRVNNWTCSCGQSNTGNFCIKCGQGRPAANQWTCSCGTVNNGNFCASCGKAKVKPGINLRKEVPAVPQNNNNNNNNKMVIGALLFVLFLVVSGGTYWILSDNDSNNNVSTAAAVQQNSDKKQNKLESSSSANISSAKPVTEKKDENSDLQVASDLSLGGLILGDPESKMRSMKGNPNRTKSDGNMVRNYYADMEIVVEYGVVTALVSNGSNVRTKRGLHEGSSLDDVIKTYGDSSMKFEDDELIMYEYKFNTDRLGEGMLRYAVNKSDKRVNYISARTLN